jgi:adenine/guanine phosphoribosyltransferase-like PRPP-binding protein
MKRVTLMGLLGHPLTQTAVQQLASGVDPRLVAAQAAGNALAGQVAMRLGAPQHVVKQAHTAKNTPGRKPSVVADDDEIVDAEFTVIDVTPGVKKRTPKGGK